MNIFVYLGLLVTCCVFALWRGGAPERLGVAILVAAIVASSFVPAAGTHRFYQMESGLLAVDSAMLVAVTLLALFAQRYWPMWLAAVNVNIVVTHLLMLDPRLMPWSYAVANAAWSYPIPVLLAAGAWRHRQRIARYGSDPAWSQPGGPDDEHELRRYQQAPA